MRTSIRFPLPGTPGRGLGRGASGVRTSSGVHTPLTPLPRPLPGVPGRGRRFIALVLLTLIAGCWKDDMSDDAHAKPLEASSFFADGKLARPLINGTVPRGHKTINDPLYAVTGGDPAVENAGFPFPITRADLDAGQEQFAIFCMPCHGGLGDGNGMIVQRGFPRPPSFVKWVDRPLTDREKNLQATAPGHYYNVISHGYGAMYSYGDRIKPADRWRIVAYVRALQLSERKTPATASTRPAEVK